MDADDIAAAYADVADRLARFDRVQRAFTGRMRRRQFGDVEGRVLDVACGTGSNVPHLPDDVDYVGIDVSPAMLEKARERLAGAECEATLSEMDAQDLAFPDDHFDAVLSSFSTCTFPDPIVALHEMRRVCKPGGEIRLLEHGRSDAAPIARFQDWRAEAHYETVGCRWDQDPAALARTAGVAVDEVRTALFGIVVAICGGPGDATGADHTPNRQ